MADAPRFLIGYGERLTAPVVHVSGGSSPPPPYELAYARTRLAPSALETSVSANGLPSNACQVLARDGLARVQRAFRAVEGDDAGRRAKQNCGTERERTHVHLGHDRAAFTDDRLGSGGTHETYRHSMRRTS